MKTKLTFLLSFLLFSWIVFVACRKAICDNCTQDHPNENTIVPGILHYSTLEEFAQGLNHAANLIASYQVKAYRDTTPDGKPDIHGLKEPLVQNVQNILNKLHSGQVEAAVYDVFHFDGNTFSLISYLMKARMVNDISAATLTNILAEIPVPPVPVEGFTPPVVPGPRPADIVACCKCKPKVKIKVTLVYVPDCGNYQRKTTGYVVNNKLTGMSSGIYYKFTPEVEACACGGTWTHSITAPAGASYASSYSGNPGNGVSFQGLSSGTYTVTFTYTCGGCCGASGSETLTISID